jgi:hypothetical protein
MKTSKRNRLLSLALTGSFSLFGASGAFAAAGDVISNTATLGYSVGGNIQTGIESGSGAGNSTPGAGKGSATTFMEDRLINFNVTREGGTVQVVPNTNQQVVPYIVENTGNGTHGFLLAGVHNLGVLDPHGSATNDVFTPTTIETWVDVNKNGIFEPATDNVAYIASIAPGLANVERVFVVADIPLESRVPNPLVNGDVAVVTLVAHAAVNNATGVLDDAITNDDNGNTSSGGTFTNGGAVVSAGTGVTNPDDPTTMETVFNDTATTDPVTGITIDANGANDVNQNAQQSAFGGYTIQSASLTVTKALSTLYDDINQEVSPKAIPGATVRYTITIANAAGAAIATLTDINDVLTATLMDPVLSNGGTGNAIFAGSAGNNVRIVDGTGTQTFCLADNADTNTDGCTYNGALGNAVTINLGTAAGTAVLNAGQTLTVEFNVIVQ